MGKIRLSLICLLVFTLLSPGMSAKKKSGKLKKVIAVGQVDPGSMGLDNLGPGGLSELLRNEIKKKLEKTGRYVVVLPQGKGKVSTPKEPVTPKPRKDGTYSPQDTARLLAQMQETMQELSYSRSGRVKDVPVAAQALFRFKVRSSQGWADSSGAVGMAEMFTDRSLGAADFSSKSTKLTMLCTQHDVNKGRLLDNFKASASSTRFSKVAGVSYYTVRDSGDHERTVNRVFKRALSDSVKWIDKKLKPLPWEGQIFKKKGSKLFLNAGETAGIAPGMSFQVLKRVKVSGDGVTFGSEETAVGQITVTAVYENYSIAKLSSGVARKGSRIRPD